LSLAARSTTCASIPRKCEAFASKVIAAPNSLDLVRLRRLLRICEGFLELYPNWGRVMPHLVLRKVPISEPFAPSVIPAA
jgi:hypothetical protein